MKRVSLQDIATQAGVSRMTVSRVMRGQPGASSKTQKHIQRVAEKLGYCADPRVSDVMGSFRKSQHPLYLETIAFLHNPQITSFEQVYQHAQNCALKQGYRLESIPISESNNRSRKLHRILTARGMRGLLITPGSRRPLRHFTLPWQHYASVIIGSSLVNKGLPRVRVDHFQLVTETLRRVVKLKYRNIGLLVDHDLNERTGRHLTGAFLAADLAMPLSQRAQSIRLIKRWHGESIRKWIEQRAFDCLIVDHSQRRTELEALGYRFPADLGLASISVGHNETEVSGTHQNAAGMAQAALSLLTVLLKTNQMGLQADAPVIHTPGIWQHGNTLK